MLYAVIQRFDSLREIETSMTAEVRKLHHVGINSVPRRSTLSDANARRSEKFFEEVYRDLYAANKDILSSDSRRNGTEEWIKQLRIIDSTTISLFSNAIFKGVGRHPKTGKKKGGIKVHSVIHANEGVPATCGSLRRRPMTLSCSLRAITATTRLWHLTVHISTMPNSRN